MLLDTLRDLSPVCGVCCLWVPAHAATPWFR
jgi:hypothetical protein